MKKPTSSVKVYHPDLCVNDAAACLWWDRIYGPELQKAKTIEHRKSIVKRAAAEYRMLMARRGL